MQSNILPMIMKKCWLFFTNIAYLGLNWYQLQQKFEGWVKKTYKSLILPAKEAT